MSTNCAPLLVFFVLTQKRKMHTKPSQSQSQKQKCFAKFFDLTFRYVGEVLSHKTQYFNECLHLIYRCELEIKIPQVECLFYTVVFSKIMTQMENFKIESLTH